MSYIELINAFERWLETNYLPSSAQLLWYKLIALFNKAGWSEWVTVDNYRLMALLDVKREATFISYRDRLIEAGLFEYQKGKKGFPNRYKICTIIFESTNSSIKSSTMSSISSSIKSSQNRSHIRLDKDKEKDKEVVVVDEYNKNNISDDNIQQQLQQQEQLQKKLIECTGTTNLNAIAECISYLDDMPYEVIEQALVKASERNGGWKYAKAILQKWLAAGIITIEQVRAEELNYKNKENVVDKKKTVYQQYEQRDIQNFDNFYAN